MSCPSCHGSDPAGEVCFACGRGLSGIREGTIVGSRYEILGVLGKGAVGTVYHAYDRILDETVALKILRADPGEPSDTARRFRSEIKLARKVTHPNVCRIYEYGEDDQRRYISMELIEGRTVKELLSERGPYRPEEAFELAIQTAEALQAIHEAGIVHRDLKTLNMMQDPRGAVRLMDFGIATRFTSGASAEVPGAYIVGTPEYMSPEQARGLRVDARSDLYALGVVIFEVLTGEVPFCGSSPPETLLMHIQEPPPLEGPASARIPPALLPVLRKALAKSPEERYASAREMAEALREARSESRQRAEATLTVLARGGTRQLRWPDQPSGITVTLRQPGRRSSGSGTISPVWKAAAVLLTVNSLAAFALLETAEQRLGAAREARRLKHASPLPSASIQQFLPHALGDQKSGFRSQDEPVGDVRPGRPSRILERPAKHALLEPEPLSSRETTTVDTSPVATAAQANSTSAPKPSPPSPTDEPSLLPAEPSGLTVDAASVDRPEERLEWRQGLHPARPDAERDGQITEQFGRLQLGIRPWAHVTVDGAYVGETPLEALNLRPGVHTARLINPDYRDVVRKVRIRPGQTYLLLVDLRLDGISK